MLDENGKQVVVTMGSYGIGVSRAVAAIAEQTYDELGLCWPREVAPADVHIVATGKDDAVLRGRRAAHRRPRRRGRPGAARRPPRRLARGEVQGRRAARRPDDRGGGQGLADGVVEVRDRATGEREVVAVDAAAARLVAICRS